jgi:hypothetical protein
MLSIIKKDSSMSNGVQQAIVQYNGQCYLVSQTSRMRDLETFVFKCNSEGSVSDWAECGGGKFITLDDVLEDFANNLHKL